MTDCFDQAFTRRTGFAKPLGDGPLGVAESRGSKSAFADLNGPKAARLSRAAATEGSSGA